MWGCRPAEPENTISKLSKPKPKTGRGLQGNSCIDKDTRTPERKA